jgi:hypothetical protein
MKAGRSLASTFGIDNHQCHNQKRLCINKVLPQVGENTCGTIVNQLFINETELPHSDNSIRTSIFWYKCLQG